MPMWENDEMQQCLEKLYPSGVDKFEDEEKKRWPSLPPLKTEFFGNVPRYVIMANHFEVCSARFCFSASFGIFRFNLLLTLFFKLFQKLHIRGT
jgi:hypothetical protein